MTPAASPTAGSSIARGAAWMVLFKVLDRSIGLVSTLVLARLLTPADFGLVAMATAVVALVELMSAFGFDVALIQRRDLTRAHYDTAWTFNVILGVGIGVVIAALAIPASEFYREPRLAAIMPVLALSSAVLGCENVGTVDFRKSMNFRREFYFLLGKRLAAFIVTMALAFTLRTYWALVAGIFTGKILAVVLSYMVHAYRPRLSLAASRDLLSFSKWLFLTNMVTFMTNRSGDLILGRTLGAASVGMYSVAYEISILPSTELVAPLNRAALPGYSQIATDHARLRAAFLSVIGMIALLVVPVGVGLAAVASPAVHLLLGPQWTAAIPLIEVLAVIGALVALQSNTNQVLFALGKPRLVLLVNGAGVLFLVPLIYFNSVRIGLTGIAWAYVAQSIVTFPLLHFVFFRASGTRFADYLATVWRPLVASAIMGAIVTELRSLLDAQAVAPVATLATCVAAGAIVYVAVVLALWHACRRPAGAERSALNMLQRRRPP